MSLVRLAVALLVFARVGAKPSELQVRLVANVWVERSHQRVRDKWLHKEVQLDFTGLAEESRRVSAADPGVDLD